MRGVHTALVTPFENSGEVDLPTFRALVRRQIEGGVDGVVVCGTTGEAPTLETAEKEALLAAAIEESAGRVVVTMGVGTNATRSTVKNSVRARELGADLGLLVLPYYNKPNQAGLVEHVRAAVATGLKQVVYHVPGRTGQRLSPADLAAVCAIDGVVACKEATGELLYGQDFLAKTDVDVLSGDDFTWLPLLSVGGVGVISVLSNVAPKQTVAVWKAWERGDVATARRIHAQLYPFVHYLFSVSNPLPCKAAMAAMGLCRADARLPLQGIGLPAAEVVAGLE